MILVIDVGNTNIVAGAFEGDTLLKTFRISTVHERSSDEFGMFLSQLITFNGLDIKNISDVIISSVVPQVMFSLERAVKKYLGTEPIIVSPQLNTGIEVTYDNPKEVGADRIVNAVAASKLHPGRSIIIDFGTATTFCALDDKKYLGGVICPGIKISLDALISRTAKLPKIELVKPENIIGKNTVTSMQSGMIYGYAGQVEYIVKKIKEEMGDPENIKVIATGGMSSLIALATDSIDILEPNLTIHGLKFLYDMNK